MNILIVDNGSAHIGKIADFFDSDDVRQIAHDDPSLHETPGDTLTVLSGGRNMSVIGHLDEYKNQIEFARKFGGPIIGICLGFEIIAHAHGSWLTRLETRSEGIKQITTTIEGEALELPRTAYVYEGHRWAVKDLEEPLVTLARSDDGVEILKHRHRPVYGTQFHPEVSAGNDGEKILHTLVRHAMASVKSTSMI